MDKLDFSGINKIAYEGFSTQEERDSLLEAGFTVVDEATPFEAPAQPAAPPTPEEEIEAPERQDYKRLYRLAFNFHEKHSPPVINKGYWEKHIPGVDDTPEEELSYWEEVTEDMRKTSVTSGNDPFLMDLLTAIVSELDREYKRLRETASKLAL